MSDSINALLEQKTFLLRELQHRVMNSLNLLSSVLDLQRRHIADPDARVPLHAVESLWRALIGRIPDRAHGLAVAYFAQHQLDELIPEQSVYDHVRRLMPDAPEAKVRARAGAIGFSGAAADTPVKTLSGGEKARLLLGLATFAAPNLIILDEPTNHLDIDSRAALMEGINDYPGAVILVSHDRYLIEACADRLWLVADGTVTPYEGDLDDYRRQVLGRDGKPREERRDDEPRVSRTDQRRAAAEKRIDAHMDEAAAFREKMLQEMAVEAVG